MLETRKNVKCEGDVNCGWHAQNNPQEFEKETGGTGNPKKNLDHTDNRIIISGSSPGDPRRLAVTQTPVKDY